MLIARHGDVVAQLLCRIGRSGGAARLAAGGAGRIASRQLCRTDERIELAERAGGQIVGIATLAGTRLVGGDVRVATPKNQLAGRVEHPEAQVAAEAVAVVEVDHRGPALQAVAEAADDLDLLIVEGERVPVDIVLPADIAGDADRVAVGLEKIADVLGRAEGVVGVGGVFAVLAGEQRVVRQPLHVDADRGIADVGIPHGGAGLLVLLAEADPQFVGTARRAAGDFGRVGEIGLVLSLCGGRVVAWLAADADVILRLRAGRLAGLRQHDPHPRIPRVGRVEIATVGWVLVHVERDAESRGGKRRVYLAVDRPCQHVPVGVEQFHHGVERGTRLVEVDPDLAAGVAHEAVDVHVGRGIVGDVTMHLEAEPAVVVAALLLRRSRRVGAGGVVGREHAEHLRVRRGGVLVETAGLRLLRLLDDCDVAVVGEWQELQASPVAGRWCRSDAVGIGVLGGQAERVEARADRVVLQRCENHGVAGLADHLHGAADPVVDVEAVAGRREPGGGTRELHHEAGVGRAHEPDAGRGVEVLDDDLVLEHVDDVDVVPDALDGDLLAADLHAADRPAGGPAGGRVDRVGDAVVADERAEVVVVPRIAVDRAGAAARIGPGNVGERVGVDADDRAQIVAEFVADDHRLSAADEDRGCGVRAAAIAIGTGRAGGVVLDPAVGHPQVGLVRLDHVELVESALDGRLPAAEGDVGVVDAGLRTRVRDDAAPVSRGPSVGEVGMGEERAAGAEAVVAEAREDHRLAGGALGDQLRGASLQFDSRSLQFHDHPGIDREPAAPTGEAVGILERQGDARGSGRRLCRQRDGPRAIDARDRRAAGDARPLDRHADPQVGGLGEIRDLEGRAAGGAGAVKLVDVAADSTVDEQVFLQHVDDVGALEPGRHVELVDHAAEIRANVHEQAIDRVVEQRVAADFRTRAAVALLEAVGIGRDAGPGAVGDRVEGQRRPRALELQRCVGTELRVDEYLAAAVGDGRLADGIQEHLLRGRVGVGPHDDAAPLAARLGGADTVRITADRVVVIRGELHVVGGGAQHLQRGRGPRRDRAGRGADVDDRGAELDDRTLVDHHGHALRHVERLAVGQSGSLQGGADQVGQVRIVADDADERLGADVGDRGLDRVVGRGDRAVAAVGRGFVDVDRVGRRGGVEPEVEGTASRAVAVAVDRRARRIDDRGRGRARGLEAKLQLVGAVAAAAVAAVAHVGVEGGVPGAGNGDEVGARRHVEPDERVAAEGVVVAGDHRADLLSVDDVLAVERDDAVEGAGGHLARAGDDRLGRQGSRLVERERVEVDVRAVGRKILDELLGVVVAREDGLAREPAAHDGWQVVGVRETQRMADLMDCRGEPAAAVFAGAPVEVRVHDGDTTARDAADAHWRDGRLSRPGIAGGDGDAAGIGLFEADAGVAAVQFEDLAGPLLLLGRDGVVEQVAGGIGPVHVLEVVLDDGDGAAVRSVEQTVAVLRGLDRDLAVAGLIDRAGLCRIIEAACGRGYRPARSVDGGTDGGTTGRERAQVGRGGEARVGIGEIDALLLRGRGDDGSLRIADLEPVQLVVRNRGERQHGLARGRIIGDRSGIECGDGLVIPGGRIHLEQLIGRDGGGRGLAERILTVEIDGDRVAVLRQAASGAGERLGHDRHHERTDIESEVEIE